MKQPPSPLPFCETVAAFKTIDPPVTCTTTITVTLARTSPAAPTNGPTAKSHGHHFHCSGTHFDDGKKTVTITSTTTIASGTITLQPGERGAVSLRLMPLPFCASINYCAHYCPVALTQQEEIPTSTLLVTIKTPATTVHAETVSQMFTTKALPGPAASALPHRSIVSIPPPVKTRPAESPSPPDLEPQGVPIYGNTGPGNPSDTGSHPQGSSDNGEPAPPTGAGNPHNNPAPQGQSSSSGGTKPPSGANQPQEHGGSSENTSSGHGGSGVSNHHSDLDTGQTGAFGSQGIPENHHSPPGSQGSPPGSQGSPPGSQGPPPDSASHEFESSSHNGIGPLPPAEILSPIQSSINGVSVSIGSDGVNVGGHYVPAGSPKSTIVVDGHTMTVEPGRVIAEGTSLPIPQVHKNSQTDTNIAGVPIHIEHGKVVLGGKTYTAGSQPSSIISGGHTFHLSGSQITDGKTTLNLPPAQPSPYHMNAGGQAFSLYPSQVEAPGIVVAVPRNGKASQFAYKGQTFKINPSQLVATARTVPLHQKAKYTPFVYASQTYSVGDTAIIGPTSTAQIHGGRGSFVYGRQTLYLQDGHVSGPSTTIDLSRFADSPSGSTPSRTVIDDVAISIGPKAAIIGGKTYPFIAGQSPTSIIYQGHTFSLKSHGIAIDGTALSIPTIANPTFSTITEGDLTFSVAASEVVISGMTYHIGPNTPGTTTVINGQTISIGPQGVSMAGTTETFPASLVGATPTYTNGYEVISTDGLIFSLSPTNVIINGKTYAIGADATSPTSIVIGTETISLGPGGVGLPEATITPPPLTPSVAQQQQQQQIPKVITDGNGIELTIGSTDVIINGKTYAIGPGASQTTLTAGGQTISLGPGGVGLESTTLAPLPSSASASATATATNADAAVTLPSDTTGVVAVPTRSDDKSGGSTFALRFGLKSNLVLGCWLIPAMVIGYFMVL